jgi:hypothetical protein
MSIKILRALAGMIGFTIAAAFLEALLHHFYADLIYAYKLRDDWQWIGAESQFRDLFLTYLILYGMASGIFWVILILPVSRPITGSAVGRVCLLSIIFLLGFGLTAGTLGGFKHVVDMRAVPEWILFLLPMLLLNLFLKGIFVPAQLQGDHK